MPEHDAPFPIDDPESREILQLIADGLLERLLPGTVGPAGCSRDLLVRARAAVLAVPERLRRHGVLAGSTARWIWCAGPPPRLIDLAVMPGRASGSRVRAVVVHEWRVPADNIALLLVGDAVPRDVLAVTTPTRTVADLLRCVPSEQALVAAAPLIALPGVTRAGVRACLARMGPARGVRSALELLPLLDPRTVGPADAP